MCKKSILPCRFLKFENKSANKYFHLAGRVKQGSSVPTHILHQMSEGTYDAQNNVHCPQQYHMYNVHCISYIATMLNQL